MSTWKLAACVTESYELCSQFGQILYNYHLDTYKISVALLSYPWGILYSLAHVIISQGHLGVKLGEFSFRPFSCRVSKAYLMISNSLTLEIWKVRSLRLELEFLINFGSFFTFLGQIQKYLHRNSLKSLFRSLNVNEFYMLPRKIVGVIAYFERE